MAEGLRSTYGVACAPFTKGPYSWDQALTLTSTLAVTGDVTFSGDLTVAGDFTFGDAVTDALTCNGVFNMGPGCIDFSTLTYRAIRIGMKTSATTSLKIASGLAVDAEPANNYLLGLFAKVSASEATSTDELRGAWIRTRVNDGCHVGSNAGWGYGVCGAEIQLKVYADAAATNMYSWQNSAVWAQLETQGAGGVNFKTGSYSQCVLANVGLTATTTIDSGANVAGVTINSNTAAAVTATGGFYGLFITQKTAGLLDFTSGIYINADSCTTGITIGACTTGITISGATTTVMDITGACTRGIRIGTHDWGVGVTGLSVTKTDPLFQVGGKISGANVDDGMYASSYSQLACKYSENHGSYAASWNELYITGGTLNLTGSANWMGCWGHVEIAGTVTTSTGNIAALNGSLIVPATLTNNGVIAGVQVDMILNNGYTNSGIIAGYAIGEHTDPGQNLIPIGFYMPYNACARGLLFGAPYSSGRSGLKILTDDTTWSTGATCGIYFDDGGTALTAWGEGFTVGLAVLTDSTGAAQTGWPYTAFFYKDIQANITSATNAHWPTVMINTSIGSGKILDGFDSAGVSSLHVSTDVTGTLAGGTCLSDISFGGNSTGSISGQWVYMDVRPGTNVANRTALIKLYSGSGAVATSAGAQDTAKWIKVLWDNTVMKIPLYATS